MDENIISALDKLINQHPEWILKPDPELIGLADKLVNQEDIEIWADRLANDVAQITDRKAMPNQIQYHIKVDIDFEDPSRFLGISEVEPKYRADSSGFDMSGLFYGMPDFEYDREVPKEFKG